MHVEDSLLFGPVESIHQAGIGRIQGATGVADSGRGSWEWGENKDTAMGTRHFPRHEPTWARLREMFSAGFDVPISPFDGSLIP